MYVDTIVKIISNGIITPEYKTVQHLLLTCGANHRIEMFVQDYKADHSIIIGALIKAFSFGIVSLKLNDSELLTLAIL